MSIFAYTTNYKFVNTPIKYNIKNIIQTRFLNSSFFTLHSSFLFLCNKKRSSWVNYFFVNSMYILIFTSSRVFFVCFKSYHSTLFINTF